MDSSKYILRKTIEAYLNTFDYITFEKIISKQSIFVSDWTTNMLFSKMQKKKKKLRVIGYDTVSHQMYEPSLPKVHMPKI